MGKRRHFLFLGISHQGTEESSRFRKNVFAYAESHGLGQSGGGKAQQDVAGSYVYSISQVFNLDTGLRGVAVKDIRSSGHTTFK